MRLSKEAQVRFVKMTKKNLVLAVVATGTLLGSIVTSSAVASPGDPLQGIIISLKTETKGAVKSSGRATVSVKAPVKLRKHVVRFTSQLQKLSPQKQAAFVAAVKRAYSLRKDDARQEALKGAIAKYGGSALLRNAIHVPLEGEDEPSAPIKIKVKITFKPLAIEITFTK